jgi:hypothetical protein
MSDDLHKRLTRRPRPDYEVGYGKPPVETRFAAGRSGNPRGRPRGAKNQPLPPSLAAEQLKDIIMEEAYRLVTVNDPTGPIQVPMAKAVIRSLSVNAVKGLQRAQRLFTDLVSATERDRRRVHDQFLEAAINYKFEWERELYRREQLGKTGPEPLPHPITLLSISRRARSGLPDRGQRKKRSFGIGGRQTGRCSRACSLKSVLNSPELEKSNERRSFSQLPSLRT